MRTAESLVREFEGCVLTSYQDIAKLWTIGYGHKLVGDDAKAGVVWTQSQAEDTLISDLSKVRAQVIILIPSLSGSVNLEPIIDFTFNLGIGRLASSTLRKLLVNQDWPEVKAELLKWHFASGVSSPGLLRRRQAESDCIQC